MEDFDDNNAVDSTNLGRVLLNSLGLDQEKIIRDVLLQNARSADSTFRTAIESSITRSLQDMVSTQSTLRPLVIKQNLDSAQQVALASAFPQFRLQFKPTQAEAHPFAHAHRICESEALLSLAKFHTIKTTPDGYDSYIKDVGGNWAMHTLANRSRLIHSCCPTLNPSDCFRQGSRQFITASSDLPRNYCSNLSQRCSLTAPVLTFLHSTYDMSLTDIADSMERANAHIAFGTMVFNRDILLAHEGILRPLMMYWKKTKKTIRFYFENDGQLGYEHDLCNYLDFIRISVFSSSSGYSRYTCQLMQNINSIQFFTIVRCTSDFPPSTIYRTLAMPNDIVIVRSFDWSLERSHSSKAVHMVPIMFTVCRNMFDKTFSYAMTLPDGKFTKENVLTYATSANVRIVIHGQQVMTPTPSPSTDIVKFATAVYAMAFVERYAQSRIISAFKCEQDFIRAQSESGFFYTYTIFPFRVIYRWWNDSQCWITRILTSWLRFKDRFDIKIENAFTEITYEQFVDNLAYSNTMPPLHIPRPNQLVVSQSYIRKIVGKTLKLKVTAADERIILDKLPTIRTTTLPKMDISVVPVDIDKYTVHRVIAKTDCLYISLMKAQKLDCDVQTYKMRLLHSYVMGKLPSETQRKIRHLLTTDSFGDIHIVALAALYHRIKIVICYPETYNAYCFHGVSKPDAKIVYLMYDSYHYEYLTTHEIVTTDEAYSSASEVSDSEEAITNRETPSISSTEETDDQQSRQVLIPKPRLKKFSHVPGKRRAPAIPIIKPVPKPRTKVTDILPPPPEFCDSPWFNAGTQSSVEQLKIDFTIDNSSFHTALSSSQLNVAACASEANTVSDPSVYSTVQSDSSSVTSERTNTQKNKFPDIPFKNFSQNFNCCEYYSGIHPDGIRLLRTSSKKVSFDSLKRVAYVPQLNIGAIKALLRFLNHYPQRLWNLDDEYLLCPTGLQLSLPQTLNKQGTIFVNTTSPSVWSLLCTHNHIDVPVIYTTDVVADRLPKFFGDKSFASFVHNAVREQQYIWTKSHEVIIRKFNAQASRFGNLNVCNVARTPQNQGWGYALAPDYRWILKPTDDKHSHYFDVDKLDFYEFSTLKQNMPRAILVSKDTVVFNDTSLFRTCNKLNQQQPFDIRLFLGVAGCGKTTTIIKEHDETKDLVLACTRNNRNDIYNRSCYHYNDELDKERYRTVDSYLLNSDKQYQTIWIDEAMMQHAGALFLVAFKSRCKILNILGDVTQIPYICRLADYMAKYYDVTVRLKPFRKMEISFRIPRDSAFGVSRDRKSVV